MNTTPVPSPQAAEQALGQLGLARLSDQPMEVLLQQVVDLTSAVLPGHLEASITMIVDRRPTTAAFTGRLALDLDERQYVTGHGPCLHAATTGEVVEIADARVEERWPDYTPRAVQWGSLSSLSLPLSTTGVLGGLNIYAREQDGFTSVSREAATRFASYAVVAVAVLHAYREAQTHGGQLELALVSRSVIDQAKGILMERHKLTPDQAFDLLARASMTTNRKLRDVADDLVRTGDLGVGADERPSRRPRSKPA